MLKVLAVSNYSFSPQWVRRTIAATVLLLPLAFAAEVRAYDRSDLEDLLDTNSCRRCDLRGADLEGRNLRGADLEDADLRGADLENADLRGADLQDANLREADLEGASLRDANLKNADLRDTDLRDADLRNVRLNGADLNNAIVNRGTRGLGDDRDGNDRDWNNQNNDAEREIERIYREVLGRRPERDGLRNYLRRLSQGESLQNIREDIADSREARDRIDEIYRQVLGRPADEEGLRNYRRKLADGWDIDRVQRDIERSDEARNRQQQWQGPAPYPNSDSDRVPIDIRR
ncbi:MAG TPA: pentapeptide repeat-containing protein [Oscillatoriales cyanobacterium M59_W2019_021]|nr:MAG: pentapeptide repeat-containing protein [Cyanobacteria bacterium J055]HIK30708.1 pentapeptide repeat-containing protein [Oscillatoriales cyanobacterium M4454_W2019_049]HIK51894.1 pentapeptide repeat-containing protein [Oscillatoriales cyanobacterium M59_W2019_021]